VNELAIPTDLAAAARREGHRRWLGALRSDPTAFATRMAHLAGLQPERTRLWLFARCVHAAPAGPVRLTILLAWG
jgi:hypothetical protein